MLSRVLRKGLSCLKATHKPKDAKQTARELSTKLDSSKKWALMKEPATDSAAELVLALAARPNNVKRSILAVSRAEQRASLCSKLQLCQLEGQVGLSISKK
jgi:hypothetical protein